MENTHEGVPSRDELHRLYVEEGRPLKEVGILYGAPTSRVIRWLYENGMRPRTRAEARKTARKPVFTEEGLASKRRQIAEVRTKITPEGLKRGGEKRRGREAPNKGVPWSDDQREKIMVQRSDPEYRRKMSERYRGEKSPNWKGGTKDEFDRRLDTAEWRRIRRVVAERDGWRCSDCGCKVLNFRDSRAHPKRRIQCHHIIGRRAGGTDDLQNLTTLCMSCHHKREQSERLAASAVRRDG